MSKPKRIQTPKAARIKIPKATRIRILIESGYKCSVPTCHGILAIDLHHIDQVSTGGGNEPENLLALCPTCHALYHRGEFAHEAILHWKALVVAKNKAAVDFYSKEQGLDLELKVGQLLATEKPKSNPVGFEHHFQGLHRRACTVGFVHGPNDRFYVDVGQGTIVRKNTVLTSGRTLDSLTAILQNREGKPVVMLQGGLVKFQVKERTKWGDHVLLETEYPDLSHWKMKDPRAQEILLQDVTPPETPVKMRRTAFLGEEVAFFNAPENNKLRRAAGHFQIEFARVSFRMRGEHSDLALTSVFSRIENTGAGVFTNDGCLVGVLKDVIMVKDEIGRRPVFGNLVFIPEIVGMKASMDLSKQVYDL